METEFTPSEGVAAEGTPAGTTPDVATGSPSVSDSPSYTVKIDGQEVSVTIDELLKGYQRQSDYTRKTQALAAERQQMEELAMLANALNTDPAGTIQLLQEAYGLTKAEATQMAEEMDPEEARWQQVESFMQQQQNAQRQAMIDRDIANLKAQYGDFDEMELVKHAVENRIPNLRAAFADLRFSQLEAAKADRLREERERTESKKDAQIVTGGANTQRGVLSAGATGKRSLRDVFMQSKRELGM